MSTNGHKIILINQDVAVFAQTMDAMMSVKAIEREQDDSWYIQNREKVVEEFKQQIAKLENCLLPAADSLENNAEIQKRSIHVANYCMMLFGIAYASSTKLVKLRKENDRTPDQLVPR